MHFLEELWKTVEYERVHGYQHRAPRSNKKQTKNYIEPSSTSKSICLIKLNSDTGDVELGENNSIKTDSELRDIPIIIISSVGNEEIVRESFRLGAEDFIKKPVMTSELLIKIKRLIDKKISVLNKVFVTKRKK